MTKARIMKDTSLDTFDRILNEGFIGEMTVKALGLIQGNPDQTVRELLKTGVDDGIYPYPDRNLIAPRITELYREAVICRPYKRKCEVTGETVLVHRLAPESWREHRRTLMQQGKGPGAINRLELESKSKERTFHMAVQWSDGSYSCSCSTAYNRPAQHRCHHIRGLYKAVTGKEMIS